MEVETEFAIFKDLNSDVVDPIRLSLSSVVEDMAYVELTSRR